MFLRILITLSFFTLLSGFLTVRFALRPLCPSAGVWWAMLPNVLLVLGLIYISAGRSTTPESLPLTDYIMPLTLCLMMPELVMSVFFALSALFRDGGTVQQVLRVAGWVSGAGVFAIMLLGCTWGFRNITVTPYTYRSEHIPQSFSGYCIVQISDFHLGTLRKHPDVVERIVNTVNAQKPDLIVFTGDLVNHRAEEMEGFETLLSRLNAPDGVVSVMGNHDYMPYLSWPSASEHQANIRKLQQKERDMGWRLLLNDHVTLHKGGDSIAIVGVENDGNPPFPQLGNLPKAQAGLDKDCFRILLSHDPTHWRRRVIPDTDIPLMLAGHTHGMQFSIFGFSPVRWIYPEWGGPYTAGSQTLFVSTGVGEVGFPFRFGVWPEVVAITLEREAR